ncbi:zinc ABC transporter substrate-binding protein [Paracoccus sp. IB05]|uniref:zinc ABC transporter substrate-binding protein n=1 Tax=Paracoccus sp. IB05 TaxID=2779367 RepID=UPI0018E79193|nr:zinc ABC transporter substrate-binding protein [Paracoccus sp. IB05]MBJ2151484.1 zinc ABC transporter substrate-binding protein [Paracoccus sp. IB05]
MRYIISNTLSSAAILLGSAALLPAALATAAFAEVPKVVTDIPPVHALVAAVMGDLGQPDLLLEPGASEHHFQLRPSQARALSAADLVVLIGPELTPWIEQPLALRPSGAAVLGLLAAKGTHLQNYGTNGDAEGHDHDHGNDQEHSHEDGHDHGEAADDGHDHGHDHSHEGTDPHAWLDPANGRLWLGVIAAELGRLDPENAAAYQANATAAAKKITAADTEAQALLAPVKDQPFVSFHDAWGYFTAHYGLSSAGAISPGDASTPGAKHLTELRAKVAAGEVVCLFPEAGQDPVLAERVAENTGVRIGAALDPVGTAMDPGPDLYTLLLTSTARHLAECLSAGPVAQP